MKKENYIIEIKDIENAKDKNLQIDFEDSIDGINTKNPVKASIKAIDLGGYIHITGKVQGRAILQCDLCLEDYDYDFNLEIDELFAKTTLYSEYRQETELKEGQFVTDLNGSDSIDIYDLLYQSVILDFPNKKVCGINCKGGDIFIRDENPPEKEQDPRLAIFKQININK